MAFLEPSLAAAASEVLGMRAGFVRTLSGGTHAQTALVEAGGRELVVRRFPPGDDAVEREVEVLRCIEAFGTVVPQLVAFRLEPDPVIVTTKVDGSSPSPLLDPTRIATEMALMLARLHALDPRGLRRNHPKVPDVQSPLARAARSGLPVPDASHEVLVHGDYWCGNAMWQGGRITGVVDWSGAYAGARGSDVAWCRQDLVLLGAPDAATLFLKEYERASGEEVRDLHAWDLLAAVRADPVVETWAENYRGIGRLDETPQVLRARLDHWNSALL